MPDRIVLLPALIPSFAVLLLSMWKAEYHGQILCIHFQPSRVGSVLIYFLSHTIPKQDRLPLPNMDLHLNQPLLFPGGMICCCPIILLMQQYGYLCPRSMWWEPRHLPLIFYNY